MTQVSDVSLDASLTGSILRHGPIQGLALAKVPFEVWPLGRARDRKGVVQNRRSYAVYPTKTSC